MQVTEDALPAPQTRVTKSSTPATATTLTEKQSVGPHTRSRSQQLQHTQGGSAGGQPSQVLDATASQQLTDSQTPEGPAGPSSSQHEQHTQSAMHLVSPAGAGQAHAPQPGSGAADGQAAGKEGSQAVVQEESRVKKTSKKTKETRETVVEHKEESTGAGSEHHISEGKHHRKEASAEEHAREESTAVSRQQQGAQPDANGLAEMHWPLGGESNGGQAQPGPLQRQQKQGRAPAAGSSQENGCGSQQQQHQTAGQAADNGSPQRLQTTPPARNMGPPVPAGAPCREQRLECVAGKSLLCWHVYSADLTHMVLLTVRCLPVMSPKATALARAELGAASNQAFCPYPCSSLSAGRSPLPTTGVWAELARQLEQRKQELAHKAGAAQPSPNQGSAPQQKSGTPQQKGNASQPSQGGTPQHNGSNPDSATRHRSGTTRRRLGPLSQAPEGGAI